jgi:hypothetical protein
MPQATRLAATIERWWSEIEGFLELGNTNARTEGYNRVIKGIKRRLLGAQVHGMVAGDGGTVRTERLDREIQRAASTTSHELLIRLMASRTWPPTSSGFPRPVGCS